MPIAVQNLDSTVTLQDYKPTSIDLIADVDQQQTVKVQAEATGQPAGCCDKSGAPTASPDSVSLRGPKSLLAQARVIASIDVTGKAATVSLEARVQILDARGRMPEDPNRVGNVIDADPVDLLAQADMRGRPRPDSASHRSTTHR